MNECQNKEMSKKTNECIQITKDICMKYFVSKKIFRLKYYHDEEHD